VIPVLAIALGLAGCATARRPYTAPVASAPSSWAGATVADRQTRDAGSLSRWWEAFHDPTLDDLIARAVASNLDLRTAISRVREARASLAGSRTALQPTVNASGSITVNGSSEEAGIGGTSEIYQLGFDASWELDVFGGVRSAIDVARATAQAREADRQDVLVTLVADVGSAYIDVRALQQRLSIARANAISQEQTYDLTRFRSQAGLATDLDVEQARSNLESTRAQIASLEGQLAQARHALALLLGQPPTALDAELATLGQIPQAPTDVAVGIPAETLRRRPDVRSAERQAAAQWAQVNAARADLYPTFRLAGSIGLETLEIAKLFLPGASFWSASPSVSWRAFNRSQIRQNIIVQTERQRQAVVTYESRVLGALQEVEDALIAMAKEQERRDHLANAAGAAQQAADLSLQLYTAGLRDFRDVLDSQRSLLVLQDQVASSSASVSVDLVRLYKALGGGWN
jgi:NodT family efflux transporter outer membrane factor (OMF) lipoprotein